LGPKVPRRGSGGSPVRRRNLDADPSSPRWTTDPESSEVLPDLRACRVTRGGVDYLAVSFSLEEGGCQPSVVDGRKLTACEREVAAAAAAGLSNQEIAVKRGTATRTVANQLASIYRKLGVGSRAELAAYWYAAPSHAS
jgi:DNA-binding CsgD family transcriptional regulator